MNKNVIITGAASGMGLSDTKEFLKHNWNVVMADFNEEVGTQKAIELQNKFPNSKVIFMKVDVSDAKSVDQLAKNVFKIFDSVDVIVNNAGIFASGALHELKESTWERVMNIDVKSIFLMTKAFVPRMMTMRRGVILNTASVSGLYGDYNMAAYSAAKGAVVNLTRSMALDYGKYGIRVNNIVPGPTNTSMFQKNSKEVIQSFNNASPLGHIVEPNDIAKMAYFLASDDAKSITGQNIQVTAGFGIYSGQPRQ
ncbi:SDR family NAD(P)-dependent oxidoreductase [Lactobacillus ultunensis]|uniref:Oxidoreductase, short chain dehydrogenase/reductase family protein n=1 Tax=Lactobacillus ultunensis DSM 16047 TaxID=525365 RepID=C2ELE2_9LACO|nr:SDR family oxidoreductase [Lactobacillus ultunensis]EEJ72664.1 oxidoreductase, short chain dehydrogenase/reductase family protein [Lactobacillus ultunensis DSM 16047]KRL80665.1 3-oxoacyl-[acyl-carrier-protein] reductase [Lactobacillus ultunensis DSM 16047]QQP28209.1 SDR family oxidoreductase [Lactobacillus ultunensis]